MLRRFNVNSKRFQAVDIDLHTVVMLYNSVFDLIGACGGDFDFFYKQAIGKAKVTEYSEFLRRKRLRKQHFDEASSAEANFAQRENFRINTLFAII